MKCPACNSTNIKTFDSRKRVKENLTYRRKECQECFTRFATAETIIIESLDPYVRLKGVTVNG